MQLVSLPVSTFDFPLPGIFASASFLPRFWGANCSSLHPPSSFRIRSSPLAQASAGPLPSALRAHFAVPQMPKSTEFGGGEGNVLRMSMIFTQQTVVPPPFSGRRFSRTANGGGQEGVTFRRLPTPPSFFLRLSTFLRISYVALAIQPAYFAIIAAGEKMQMCHAPMATRT